MCFNFQVSLATFISSWSISYYLLENKDLSIKQEQNVKFLMIISLIQLFDAILWYIKMKKNKINYIITSFFIPFILAFQVYYNIVIRNNINEPFVLSALAMGTIYIFIKFNGYSVSLCNNKLASPIWGNNEIKIWEFVIFAILIFYPNWQYMLLIIFILLPIIYKFVGGAYGSLWCAVANVIAFKYLIQY